MKPNLFEMGAQWSEEWNSDNQTSQPLSTYEIKPINKHRLIFAKERRRGTIVTLVREFYREKKELEALLRELKSSLSVGGTLKDNQMEFQGEVESKLRQLLNQKGFAFKN